MKKLLQFCAVAALGAGLLSTSGCKQLEARDQLNRGVTAFKAASFNEAIEHFQNAIQLDPTLINAKLYLATAYQQQFIPGAPSADNMKMAQQAIDEYKEILTESPKNPNAIAGLASLYYNMGDLDDARDFYTQSLSVSPNDPVSYYSLGAIDWQQTNKPVLAARLSMGVTDGNQAMIGPKANAAQKKTCEDLKQANSTRIDDGIQQINQALTLKPGYADAMDYMNLLYREKADLTCGNDSERQASLKLANDWAAKGLATRKAAVEASNKANNTGVAMDAPK